jgi:hypothetical protein
MASCASSGTQTAVSSSARSNRASCSAARRFVFTRSPGLRGISDGATTEHACPNFGQLMIKPVTGRPSLMAKMESNVALLQSGYHAPDAFGVSVDLAPLPHLPLAAFFSDRYRVPRLRHIKLHKCFGFLFHSLHSSARSGPPRGQTSRPCSVGASHPTQKTDMRSYLGALCWPEMRFVEYSEETQFRVQSEGDADSGPGGNHGGRRSSRFGVHGRLEEDVAERNSAAVRAK